MQKTDQGRQDLPVCCSNLGGARHWPPPGSLPFQNCVSSHCMGYFRILVSNTPSPSCSVLPRKVSCMQFSLKELKWSEPKGSPLMKKYLFLESCHGTVKLLFSGFTDEDFELWNTWAPLVLIVFWSEWLGLSMSQLFLSTVSRERIPQIQR